MLAFKSSCIGNIVILDLSPSPLWPNLVLEKLPHMLNWVPAKLFGWQIYHLSHKNTRNGQCL